MAAAAVAGLLVGIPSLRLRGDYLAIVTLGFGEIIRVLILNIDAVGGARGFVGVPQWTTFTGGWIAAAVTVVVIWNVCTSTCGRAMLAVREDEIAAAAMGVGTTRTKVLAFVISSAFAGLAGGLFAHLYYLSPATFTFIKSIEIVMMIIIGGLGSITGAVFGGVVMTILPELLRPSALFAFLPRESRPTLDLRMVIYSLLIVLIIRYRPQGLLGKRELPDILASWRRKGGGERRAGGPAGPPAARARSGDHALRRPLRRPRARHRGPRGGALRPDRAERRREDDDLQRASPASTPRPPGEVVFGGARSTGWSPARITRPASRGRSRTSGSSRELTVLENVMVALPPARSKRDARGRRLAGAALPSTRRRGSVAKALDAARRSSGSTALADEQAKNLPYGSQRRLEIARAMATAPQPAAASTSRRPA